MFDLTLKFTPDANTYSMIMYLMVLLSMSMSIVVCYCLQVNECKYHDNMISLVTLWPIFG